LIALIYSLKDNIDKSFSEDINIGMLISPKHRLGHKNNY